MVFFSYATYSAQATDSREVAREKAIIEYVFCEGKPPCELGNEAVIVSSEESGGFHWYRGDCENAANGQYLGCFQMGTRERALYGHGPGKWAQARSALKYYKVGKPWSHWSCKPQGYCLH